MNIVRRSPLAGDPVSPGIGGWWESLTTAKKTAVVLGGAAVALAFAALFRREEATPNKARKRKKRRKPREGTAKPNSPYAIYRTEKVRERHSHEPFDRIEDAVRHAERDAREKGHEFVVYDEGRQDAGPRGAFVAMFRPNRKVKNRKVTCQAAPSVPSCRCTAPSNYYRLGAKKRSDYAFPECWMYPISKPGFVRAAASRFGKFSQHIPTQFRGKVKARIRKAKKRFGIGEFRDRM